MVVYLYQGMNNLRNTTIMGIDPGTNVLGYGIVQVDNGQYRLVGMGVVEMKQQNPYEKLKVIFDRISQLIRQYEPALVAIEAPFYGKNVQSMLKLGRAQGVAIAAVVASGLTIEEYAPKRVKQAITGNGNASKEQVASMLQHLVPHETSPRFLDATDALAVAVCHHLTLSSPIASMQKGKGGWESFLRNNPDRVKG